MTTTTHVDLTPRRAVSPRVALPRGGLATAARWALSYSVAIIFIWFGCLKFTAYEASGIAPFIMNSPLISWMHAMFGVAGAAKALGVFEILAGVLIAARPVSARAAVVGGFMAAFTFVITLSFLLTTPGVIQPGEAAPFALSAEPGQILLKDLVLFCASLWVAATALDEARRSR